MSGDRHFPQAGEFVEARAVDPRAFISPGKVTLTSKLMVRAVVPMPKLQNSEAIKLIVRVLRVGMVNRVLKVAVCLRFTIGVEKILKLQQRPCVNRCTCHLSMRPPKVVCSSGRGRSELGLSSNGQASVALTSVGRLYGSARLRLEGALLGRK